MVPIRVAAGGAPERGGPEPDGEQNEQAVHARQPMRIVSVRDFSPLRQRLSARWCMG